MEKEKKIIVPIPEETSVKVERLFYEYTAGRESVKFLMKDSEVRWDVLQNYINIVEARFTELEMLKKGVTDTYLPIEIRQNGIAYDYEFLFDQSAIQYTLLEN